jgi:hypothetical protein
VKVTLTEAVNGSDDILRDRYAKTECVPDVSSSGAGSGVNGPSSKHSKPLSARMTRTPVCVCVYVFVCVYVCMCMCVCMCVCWRREGC